MSVCEVSAGVVSVVICLVVELKIVKITQTILTSSPNNTHNTLYIQPTMLTLIITGCFKQWVSSKKEWEWVIVKPSQLQQQLLPHSY